MDDVVDNDSDLLISLQNEDLNIAYDVSERYAVAIESLIKVGMHIESTGRLDDTSRGFLRVAVEQAYTLIDEKVPQRVAAEAFSVSGRPATEGLLGDIKDLIKSLFTRMFRFFKQDVDRLQAWYTFFTVQDERLSEIDRLSQSAPSGKFDLIGGSSKYMRYGDGIYVENAQEYHKKYLEAMNLMDVLAEHAGKFCAGDLMSSWKTFFSVVTGYDENYEEMWNKLYKFSEGVSKAPGMKTWSKGHARTEYRSDVLLGMSYAEANLPTKGTFTPNDVDTLKEVHKHLWVGFERVDKFEIFEGKKRHLAGATRQTVRDIVAINKQALGTYKYMIDIRSRLSQVGVKLVITDAFLNVMYPIKWWVWLLSAYRLMVRSTFVIYSTEASAFNFISGHISKSNEMLLRSLKHAS